MKSISSSAAAELRSMASRLLDMAEALDRKEPRHPDDNVSSIQAFRRSAQKSTGLKSVGRHEDMTSGFAEAIYRDRQRRFKYLPSVPFAEPAWDLLLDLYFRTCRNERVSISDACVASGVPAATALRWIDLLVACDLMVREADAADRRRIWLKPTDKCMSQLQGYFSNMIFLQSAEQALAS